MTTVEDFSNAITGAECLALVVETHSERGDPAAPVHAVFLQLGAERWARFALNGTELQWREIGSPDPELTYPRASVGQRLDWIRGRHIAGVHLEHVAPDAAGVFISFAEGKTLSLVTIGGRARLGVRDDGPDVRRS